MNIFRLTALCWILCLPLASVSFALGKDPRLAKITASQLRVAALEKPFDVERQSRLLSRANQWDLQAEAYRLYKQRATKDPNNADAHLLSAMATRLYAEKRFLREGGSQGIAAYNALLPEIRSEFEKAIALKPQDARINLSYGFWLWQFDNNMAKGLRLIKAADKIKPQQAGTIATLGGMYANPSGNCYNIKEAEQMLKSAIQLDPNYAFPRWRLISLLYEQKRPAEAKQQLNAYIAVIPTKFATSAEVSQWQKILR